MRITIEQNEFAQMLGGAVSTGRGMSRNAAVAAFSTSILADLGSQLRQFLESLADRTTHRLLTVSQDAGAIHAVLDESGREILQEFVDTMRRRSKLPLLQLTSTETTL